MTKTYRILMAMFVLGLCSSVVQAAIDWTGSGRFYHQRWSFGEDGDANFVKRQREKLDFYVNGAAEVSESVSVQVRFRYYTDDFKDSVDPFHLNKANLTWKYDDEGSFVMFGKMGVIDKNVGDHIRSYLDNRLGVAWRHQMMMGPGTVFVGASRFALGDRADKPDTDTTTYYTPQLGYEMEMGDYHLMLGGTYHLYTSLDDGDKPYVLLGTGEEMSDYAGMEIFAKIAGRLGELGWHLKFSMFNNGEAPDSAMDEDKSATLVGVGIDYSDVSLTLETNNSGTYAVNRKINDTDWFGVNAGFDGGHSTGEAIKVTASYKWSENMMPSLEIVQSERNNDGMSSATEIENEQFMMTRLSLNFMF